MKDIVYGKDDTQGIVNISVKDDTVYLFKQTPGGKIEVETRPASYWILFADKRSSKFKRLHGYLHYKYIMEYDNEDKFRQITSKCNREQLDYSTIYRPDQAYMIRSGLTYFKGLTVSDVSVLSFDIEATNLIPNKDSKVLIISNTFRDSNGNVTRRMFTYDDYESDTAMIHAWCEWVQEIDPSILIGHNIFGYDLPYLNHCANYRLPLGRDCSDATFSSRPSKFRKDGSQAYDYFNASCFGREIVDTFFLSIKSDVARKYPSYGLKSIIEYEGLERKDRQHYDASKIAQNYKDPKEWVKIKAYAEHDADDALALYDLMVNSFFYYTQSVPRSFQQVINTATGSQINSIMLRAYLQENHSIPKASEQADYEGAISFGNPGVYRNVTKVDVASLYPSIIREYRVHDKAKDPKAYFLKMIDYFTDERLANKQKGKETGDRYYKDLEQSQKIVINSGYGFMGAPKLNFNSPRNAAFVTRKGREILEQGLKWAEGKGYTIVNADTDSFSYTTGHGVKYYTEQFNKDLEELNSLYPDKIKWEDDGFYKRVVIVKAKNYLLDDGKKETIKGNSLKATMKEPALQDFIRDCLDVLKKNHKDALFQIYVSYAQRIMDIQDVTPWCFKKTITDKILKPERSNESRVLDAIKETHVNEGDKVHLFFKTEDEYCLREKFNGEYSADTLLSKLYKTLCIFDQLIDVSVFPNFSLKRNKPLLERIRNVS